MNDPKKEKTVVLQDETLEKVSGGTLLDSDGSQQTNEGSQKRGEVIDPGNQWRRRT